MISIVIPSHNDIYLYRTIDSLLSNARGEIEIIPVLDGYISPRVFDYDPRVKPILHTQNLGMREAINTGASHARGEFLMRVDEHCMFGPAYDVTLTDTIEENWIVTPRRYYLDVEKWEVMNKDFVDYEKLLIVEKRDKKLGSFTKFSGVAWPSRTKARTHFAIDETMCMQGSCWIMHKSWWDIVIIRLESNGYGTHYQDTTEMLFKTWKAGGKLMVNKNTWFAHKHRSFNRTHQYPLHRAIPEWTYAVDKHKNDYQELRSQWGI